MTTRTEHQVLADLLSWAEGHMPADARKYNLATDKRDAARKLLAARIQADKTILPELPDSVLAKIGAKTDHDFDTKELALAAAINGKPERRIFYRGGNDA